MPAQNQRHFIRNRQRVRITIAGKPCYTSDVGPGGFCAELMSVLQPGTPVQGTITFSGRDFKYAGLVRWARSGNARIGLAGHMGVRFLDVPVEFTKLLTGHRTEY